MAIFGNFADIPLPDVLSMVGQSSGTFSVWNHPSNHYYQLHLDNCRLKGMDIDGNSVTEVLEVRSHMIGLMSSQEGEFEFTKSKDSINGPLSVSLEQILLSGLTAVDEIAAFNEHLPSEDTFFKFSGRTDIYLDGNLSDFWEQCGYYLLNGASARVIQTQTGFGIDDIRLYLYKLRSLGLIVPSRRFEANLPEVEEEATEQTLSVDMEAYSNGAIELAPIWDNGETTQVEETPQTMDGYSVLPMVQAPDPESVKEVQETQLQTVETGKASRPVLKNILGHLQSALGLKRI